MPPNAPPSYIPEFGLRTLTGCLGMLLAVHVAGFNEHVTEIGLSDIRGAMHIGHDEGTWFTSWYEAFNIAAMAFAPWFYSTFSIYRFAIFMTALLAMLSLPFPFMHTITPLYILRAAQGLSAGCLPPILMTVMLKYLPLPLKVFGVGGYAMSATFGPNLGGPLEAMWFTHTNWHWLYWEVIPLSIASILMMAYGLPKDPISLSRFRTFNWRGFLLGAPSILCVVTVLYQGDRLDWFRSPLICHLTFWGGAFFIGFLIHEWHHHTPFFRLQYWKHRNIAASMMTLIGVLAICSLMGVIPSTYLIEIRNYRPEQISPISLTVALPQLIMLPITAALCNTRFIDCRYVLLFGMSCLGLAAFLGTWLTPDWVRDNFYIIQTLQVVGQPTVVIPVLLLATMSLGPADGPFISGMVNMLKGMAAAVATAVFETLLRRREHYHSTMLIDRSGNNAMTHTYGAEMFHGFIREQATTLALADLYILVTGLCIFFIILNIILPTRVYPPGKAPIPSPAS